LKNDFTDLSLLQNKISGIVEAELVSLLSCEKLNVGTLQDAMKYTTLLGGKRIRPFLTFAFFNALTEGKFFAEILKGSDYNSYIKIDKRAKTALYFSCAVELIHTYSLIHDDLPAMDNDDIRRGKPTNHKVFGEANAILAGDALLTYAFEVLTKAECEPQNIVLAVKILSECAGGGGMVGGQVLDIENENKTADLDTLLEIHKKKTGALICAACKLGCVAAGKTDDITLTAAEKYAINLGTAFQIIDDILDEKGESAVLGKTAGKDKKSGKTTFLSFFDMKNAEKHARDLTKEATDALACFSCDKILYDLSYQLLLREK